MLTTTAMNDTFIKSQFIGILEAFRGGWVFSEICDVEMFYEKNTMAIAVPRKALNMGNKVSLSFKWLGSMSPDSNILELYTHGDAAPSGRFAYRYEEQ